MKKIFLILGFLIAFTLSVISADAKTNQLHTITLENNGESYNIVLDADFVPQVTKKIVSDSELILKLSGITSADTVNALYKGTEHVDNLVIENAGLNNLNIYINAPNIKSSSVMVQPLNGQKTLVGESFPADKVIWSVFVLIVLATVAKRSVRKTNEDSNILIKRDIKDREIALYKQYRRSLDEGINIRPKDIKMKNMLKKIDRKIDERLSLSLRK